MNLPITTQYFIPFLTLVERGVELALVGSLTGESQRLHRGASSTIVFKRFRPSPPYIVTILRPFHQPA